MNRGAWQAAVHGVAKGWTRLSNKHTFGIWFPEWTSVAQVSGTRHSCWVPTTVTTAGTPTLQRACLLLGTAVLRVFSVEMIPEAATTVLSPVSGRRKRRHVEVELQPRQDQAPLSTAVLRPVGLTTQMATRATVRRWPAKFRQKRLPAWAPLHAF